MWVKMSGALISTVYVFGAKCIVNDQQYEPSSHRQSLPAGLHYHRGQGSYPGGLFKVNI